MDIQNGKNKPIKQKSNGYITNIQTMPLVNFITASDISYNFFALGPLLPRLTISLFFCARSVWLSIVILPWGKLQNERKATRQKAPYSDLLACLALYKFRRSSSPKQALIQTLELTFAGCCKRATFKKSNTRSLVSVDKTNFIFLNLSPAELPNIDNITNY